VRGRRSSERQGSGGTGERLPGRAVSGGSRQGLRDPSCHVTGRKGAEDSLGRLKICRRKRQRSRKQ